MNFLPIAPINNLDILNKQTHVMVLAHLYKNEQYVKYYTENRNKYLFMLMDNGAAENSQLSNDELLTAIDIFKPDVVVAPDEINNFKNTVKKTTDFLLLLDKEKINIGVMGAVQGKDKKDYELCYCEFNNIFEIQWLGISKFSAVTAFRNRCNCLNHIYKIQNITNPNKKNTHLLGCNNPIELCYASQFINIKSCDSCIPFLYALQDLKLDLDTSSQQRLPTPEDYFEKELTGLQSILAKANINMINNLF